VEEVEEEEGWRQKRVEWEVEGGGGSGGGSELWSGMRKWKWEVEVDVEVLGGKWFLKQEYSPG
jgi:hypothetical protein